MKKFISSYQGSAEYEVNGIRYEVRTFAMPESSMRAEYKATERAKVGTIIAAHFPEATVFPAQEVVMQFPGYIAARINPAEGYAVEYQHGAAPETFVNHLGWLEVRL